MPPDHDRIRAAQPEAGRQVAGQVAEFLFSMEEFHGVNSGGNPKLHFVTAEPLNDTETRLTALIEPDSPLTEYLWRGGLENALWIHSDRIGRFCVRDPDWHARMCDEVFLVAATAHVSATAGDGAVTMERLVCAVDRFSTCYTLRRVLTGPQQGLVDLLYGHLDPRWDAEETTDNAETYGYKEAHAALSRILEIFGADHAGLQEADREGAFEIDPRCAARLNEPDGAAVADMRDVAAAHGYVPWDHRTATT